jgi:hypothetical protein
MPKHRYCQVWQAKIRPRVFTLEFESRYTKKITLMCCRIPLTITFFTSRPDIAEHTHIRYTHIPVVSKTTRQWIFRSLVQPWNMTSQNVYILNVGPSEQGSHTHIWRVRQQATKLGAHIGSLTGDEEIDRNHRNMSSSPSADDILAKGGPLKNSLYCPETSPHMNANLETATTWSHGTHSDGSTVVPWLATYAMAGFSSFVHLTAVVATTHILTWLLRCPCSRLNQANTKRL